jgi:hypothetical protein
MTCYLFFVFRFGDGEKPVFFFAAKDIRRGIPHRFFCTKTPGLLRLLLAVSKLQKKGPTVSREMLQVQQWMRASYYY